MRLPALRLLTAAGTALSVLAACAGGTGAQWTYAPVAVVESAAPPVESAAPGSEPPAASEPPASSAAPEGTAGPVEPGEARVIDIIATGALQFTTPSGEQLHDIPVTPGETVLFRIDNTAGFDHDFYIGTDDQLMAPSATTDTGIPPWQTGVQELEWVVPADIGGLKFGCTVPGHYTLMQGTFSVAAGEPGATPVVESAAPPVESAAPGSVPPAASEPPASSAASGGHGGSGRARRRPRHRHHRHGRPPVHDALGRAAPRHPRDAGRDGPLPHRQHGRFRPRLLHRHRRPAHGPGTTTDTGIPPWQTGVQELEWVVPADIGGLKFGCTVPGHYTLMQGTFSVAA